MLTLRARAEAFARTYAKWPASWPWCVTEQGHDVLYAIWVIGADYRNRSRYYGAYPHGYLDRLYALFPDVVDAAVPPPLPLFGEDAPPPRPAAWPVLHVFSGSLPPGPYVRCDSHQPAELRGSVYDLPQLTPTRFALVIADPPYSAADAVRYGTPMIDRRRAMAALAGVTHQGGYCAWLDTCWPMHRKREWRTVGRIAIQRSTNHRARVLSIFERVA